MAIRLTATESHAWQLFQALPDAVLVTDTHGVIQLINDQAVSLFGYAPHELIGQPVECLVPTGRREVHRKRRGAYVAVEHPLPMGTGPDVAGVRKDGSLVPVEVRISAITLEAGRAALAVVRDVSQRNRAAEKVRVSEELFRASFEHAPIGMALIDLRHEGGRILRANAAFSSLTGHDTASLLAMTSAALTHPADREETTATLGRLAEGLDRECAGGRSATLPRPVGASGFSSPCQSYTTRRAFPTMRSLRSRTSLTAGEPKRTFFSGSTNWLTTLTSGSWSAVSTRMSLST